MIERLLVLCAKSVITLADLPAIIGNFVLQKKMPQPTLRNQELDVPAAVQQFEQRLIDEAVWLADGNKAKAAGILKLQGTTLVAKLRSRSRRKETNAPQPSPFIDR